MHVDRRDNSGRYIYVPVRDGGNVVVLWIVPLCHLLLATRNCEYKNDPLSKQHALSNCLFGGSSLSPSSKSGESIPDERDGTAFKTCNARKRVFPLPPGHSHRQKSFSKQNSAAQLLNLPRPIEAAFYRKINHKSSSTYIWG